MKVLLFTALLFSSAVAVNAQEVEGCFMVDSYGRYISLGGMCQGNPVSVPVSTSNTGSLTNLQEGLALLYSEEYCDYRRSNRPQTEARAAGEAKIMPLVEAGMNWDAFYDYAQQAIDKQCPGL